MAKLFWGQDPSDGKSDYSPSPYSVTSADLALTEWKQRKENRRWELMYERRFSTPYHQFKAQYRAEFRRIWLESHPGPFEYLLFEGKEVKMAYEAVKNLWIEQGIWKDEWNDVYRPSSLWKHEEPLESEPESEPEWEFPDGIFGLPKQKPKSDEERQRNDERRAERRAVREREREASRPCHQFDFQLSKQRERIEGEAKSDQGNLTTDAETKAYGIVKSAWVKQGIWDERWGSRPGMSWKHEEPIESDDDEDDFPSQDVQPVNHGTVHMFRFEKTFMHDPDQSNGIRDPFSRHIGIFPSSIENGHTEQPLFHLDWQARDSAMSSSIGSCESYLTADDGSTSLGSEYSKDVSRDTSASQQLKLEVSAEDDPMSPEPQPMFDCGQAQDRGMESTVPGSSKPVSLDHEQDKQDEKLQAITLTSVSATQGLA